MEEGRLALLRAEMWAQIGDIETIYAKVKKRQEGEEDAYLESLAYQLHNLYCAFEDLFKRVAHCFENQIDDAARYHLVLLKRMAIAVEGVRPALLSSEGHRLLENMRAFRHLFRHAYSYDLDVRKVKLVLEDALRLKVIYREDVERFLKNIEGESSDTIT